MRKNKVLIYSMKKEDAELKANALAKDLVTKEAEHKISRRRYIIISIEAVQAGGAGNYEVFCFFNPVDNTINGKKMGEDITYFLSTYKVLTILSLVS